MTDLPWLAGRDIAALVPLPDAVDVLSQALRSGRIDPEVDAPRAFSPAPGGEFLLMASSSTSCSGVKVVSVAPDNPARGRPKIQGVYILFRSDDLTPIALMDGVELTLLRTAATSVVAVKELLGDRAHAQDAPLRVVVLGAGPQAERHLRCADAVLGPIDAVVVGRTAGSAAGLVERCVAGGLLVREGSGADVRDADVVFCATSASTPVIRDADVRDDAVIAAIGTHGLERSELPPELVRRGDVVVEGRSTALRESGNLLGARSAQEWSARAIPNLADLMTGRFTRTPGRPAIYSAVGMAWQDLVIATEVLKRHDGTDS